MNLLPLKSLLFFLMSLSTAYANSPNDFWRCLAKDNEMHQWQFESAYQREAINRAFDACKKQSSTPKTCHTAREMCEYFSNGQSTRPLWRCLALDQMAKSWSSNLYPNRDDAAIAAKAYCKDKSAMPDSCYVNLLTCKNVNS